MARSMQHCTRPSGPFLLTALLLFLSGLPSRGRPGAKKRYEKGDWVAAVQRDAFVGRVFLGIPAQPCQAHDVSLQ